MSQSQMFVIAMLSYCLISVETLLLESSFTFISTLLKRVLFP